MPLNSLGFVAFLTTVLVATALIPLRWRWLGLLLASYTFYASFGIPYLLGVLLLVTGISYGCGRGLAHSTNADRKRALLWLGIAGNVLTLLVLKYTGFISENLRGLLHLFGIEVALPGVHPFASVGVSFFVFQGISYVIDVYLETASAERHLGFFALHMAFFSKLTQGPIERASDLLPQLHAPVRLTLPNAVAGLHLLFWGFFKKVVVADRLSAFVSAVYSDVHAYEGLPLLLATYLFAAQLYFDFSGYTDMARGTARLFGIELVENFNSPYYAASVAEFWRRWHMSFTAWILDYVFKPLQFELRRWQRWGTPISLLVTFLITGLWHGASWCFVVWGGLHGVFMGTAVLASKPRRKLASRLGVATSSWVRPLQVLITFHLVCLAWVFFRAQTLRDALHVTIAAVAGLPSSISSLWHAKNLDHLLWLEQGRGAFVLALALVLFMAVAGWCRRAVDGGKTSTLAGRVGSSPWLRTGLAAVMLYLMAFHGASAQSFIYVQF